MSFNEYASFDGLALGRMVRERKITPAELMEAAIARAEKHNAKLNAIVFRDYDRALAVARERKVGPPLDMRFTCIGCPLPQFGIAISRRSLPAASISVKKRFESAITLPER